MHGKSSKQYNTSLKTPGWKKGKHNSIIGFSSVELPQLTDTIRGNKVVGQVALLAQHQPLGWKIFPKKNPFKTDFF